MPVVSSRKPSNRLVLQLLFDRDDGGVRAELPRHILHQFALERLVHRHHHAARISREAMRSLPRTSSFSARSFTEMPSVTEMGLGDRQRLPATWACRRSAVAAGSPSSGLPSPSRSADLRVSAQDEPRAASPHSHPVQERPEHPEHQRVARRIQAVAGNPGRAPRREARTSRSATRSTRSTTWSCPRRMHRTASARSHRLAACHPVRTVHPELPAPSDAADRRWDDPAAEPLEQRRAWRTPDVDPSAA